MHYCTYTAENFREAKKLKLVIEELTRAGEVLCRYEVEKKQAIEREDYDTAKTKKVSKITFKKWFTAQQNLYCL